MIKIFNYKVYVKMKKIVITISLMATILAASPKTDLTSCVKLINECKQLKNIKYKLGVFDFFGDPNRLSYGFSYGFKNDSNETLNVKAKLNFKDMNNNTIADMERDTEIKPHYSKPFNTGSYASKDMSEVGDDFSGITELILNCETEASKTKTDSKFKSINIPTKLWDKFAEKNGGEIGARIKLFTLIAEEIKN